eukprot:RCo028494
MDKTAQLALEVFTLERLLQTSNSLGERTFVECAQNKKYPPPLGGEEVVSCDSAFDEVSSATNCPPRYDSEMDSEEAGYQFLQYASENLKRVDGSVIGALTAVVREAAPDPCSYLSALQVLLVSSDGDSLVACWTLFDSIIRSLGQPIAERMAVHLRLLVGVLFTSRVKMEPVMRILQGWIRDDIFPDQNSLLARTVKELRTKC